MSNEVALIQAWDLCFHSRYASIDLRIKPRRLWPEGQEVLLAEFRNPLNSKIQQLSSGFQTADMSESYGALFQIIAA